MKKIAAALALAISLAGCATVPGRLGDLARAVTTTIQRPDSSASQDSVGHYESPMRN